MNARNATKQVDTIVIGGGQAGLATGYHLSKLGRKFLILDAGSRIGDAWRNRWDSLRLFTPARYAGLPGYPFPARGDSFPTKDQVASYLVEYAARFGLQVQTGTRVDRLWKQADGFALTAGNAKYQARNVVVAMADYQLPKIPDYADRLEPSIFQMHAQEYRNPSQLKSGSVLIVGVGNSGAEIGLELAKTRQTWLAGTEPGHIPWPIESFVGRFLLVRFVRFFGHHILTIDTRLGRKLRPKLTSQAAPLIRVKPQDLTTSSIERVTRVVGVESGRPLLADGRTLDVENVIWCTGYHHSFPWIDLPISGQDGKPRQTRGVVSEIPGLYFVGLHFQYAMTSSTLIGVGRDAEYVARQIASRPGAVTGSFENRAARAS